MKKNVEFSLLNFKRIAASNLTKFETFADVVQYFKILWCKRYNKPFKDPLLNSYTVHELILEIMTLDFVEDQKALDEFIRKDNGEIDAIMEDDEKWFRDEMGEGYTSEEYRSEEYYKQMAAIKARKEKSGEKEELEPNDIVELPDGEYEF